MIASAIQSICDSAILLENGRMAMHGKPETVMDYYNALLAEREGQTVRQETLAGGQVQTISGTGEAGILSVRLLDEQRARHRGRRSRPAGGAGSAGRSAPGHRTAGTGLHDQGSPWPGHVRHQHPSADKALTDLQAGERVTYRFAFVMGLGKGNYSVALSLSRLDSHLDRNFEWRDYGLVFHVINNRQEDFVGCSWLDAKTTVTRSSANRVHSVRARHDPSFGGMHPRIPTPQGQFGHPAGGAQRRFKQLPAALDGVECIPVVMINGASSIGC